MKFLPLLAALALPWANGYIWLNYFESFFEPPVTQNHFRVAGYGFFLGYACLSLIILLSSTISGKVSFTAVMSTMMVLAGLGILLSWLKNRPARYQPSWVKSPENTSQFHWAGFGLLLLLLLWIFVHLVFSIVEMLTLPVYPWDAWLLWVYRAKAWFYMGGIFDFYNATDWPDAASISAYTVNVPDYPLFASVIPFWTAISLGYWSETLINIPVVLCGMAIGMALYGQCREYGLSTLLALVFCYFLFSTPLFGTHLSLGGYADIWMAGFNGLGFVALFHGSIAKCRKQLVIGLVMVALGVLVKNEGLVWLFAAAIFLLIVHVSRRISLLVLAIAAALILLPLAFGITMIEIPFLGQMGVADNKVILPFIGTFTMVFFNVWKEFFVSFFVLGSWNLTWALVISSVLISVTAWSERASFVTLSFFLIFVSTQVFIFTFTNHGEWAVEYTTINRLSLHFLPALLFSMAVLIHHRFKKPEDVGTDRPGHSEHFNE